MSSIRTGQPGATRLCPHCKATVLESATICPGCRHHLRFNGGKQAAVEAYTALSVDGTIAHRQRADPCEYCIVLDIANERGERVLRQVVGVGALQPGEQRRLHVSVQMLPLVPAQSQAAAQPTATAQSQVAAQSKAAAQPRTAAQLQAPAKSPATAQPQSAAQPRPTAQLQPTAPLRSTVQPQPIPQSVPRPLPKVPAKDPPPASVRPAPAATPAGATAPVSVPPAATATAPSPAAPSPGGTLGQRLRIFRKP